nr:homeobox domain-containing protein [Candidatus Obscuribacter sp.]
RGTRLEADAPGAMERARTTPFQRGEIVDARQQLLRDGTFIPERQATGLHTETWFGKVKTESGEVIPAVFRPNDRTEAFAIRMQNEIAGYGMNGLGFKTNVPATVARTAEINGKSYSGYIQEMNGPNLVEHVRSNVGLPENLAVPRPKATEVLKSSTSLSTSYADAFTHRMVMGEWDNHAMNMSVSDKVHNIDLGYAFRVPKTTLEFAPLPMARKAHETMSQGLYNELAGKALSPEAKSEMQNLYQRYSSSEGRAQLEALGLTPRQVDGVLGRTNWFATRAFYPRQQEAVSYVYLAKLSQLAKSVLKRPAPQTLAEAPANGS